MERQSAPTLDAALPTMLFFARHRSVIGQMGRGRRRGRVGNITAGLRASRAVMLAVNDLGVPVATEFPLPPPPPLMATRPYPHLTRQPPTVLPATLPEAASPGRAAAAAAAPQNAAAAAAADL